MREDKFRAWVYDEEKEENKMVNVIGIFFKGNSFIPHRVIIDEEEKVWLLPNSELMQFTGLKDSKGKEIYEGDIVRFYEQGYDPNEPDEERIEPETTTVLVRWDEDGKCLAIDWDYGELDTTSVGWGYEWILNSEFDYHEVIGNIWENPELLKEVDPRDMGYYAEKK
jgi:uncharacterized phage protein (TIGR01671 family)